MQELNILICILLLLRQGFIHSVIFAIKAENFQCHVNRRKPAY